MRALILAIFLTFLQAPVASQNCDFTSGFKALITYESKGAFKEGLLLIDELNTCKELQPNSMNQINLLIYEYKFKRNQTIHLQ